MSNPQLPTPNTAFFSSSSFKACCSAVARKMLADCRFFFVVSFPGGNFRRLRCVMSSLCRDAEDEDDVVMDEFVIMVLSAEGK